ncbi:CSMD1-like protein [Mya arenaria]|uniref:CSMD1-like protein n=1 Tax=Mya arenaria TaxID=6604 RepID=A0ABY7FRI7_MYAAR|nr:CSMD1-like protein [Mya arenaria]
MFFFIKKIKTMMAILMEILFSVLVLCATVCAVEQDWHFSGLNVALGKRAIQTPFTHGYQNAPLAVDGNIPNLSQNDSCAQATVPLKKQYAIWEVDLESTYNISGIKIYYRENTSLERLSRLTILTFYNTWESVSKDNFLRCPDYHDQEIKPLVCQDIINVVLHPPVLSNHVRLKMNNSLTLCEVEIISVACKRPNVPNGGTNAEAKTLNGISINLKCDEGFFTNESTSMCTAQGTWNPQPRCAKGCKEPTLSNGKYAYTNSERLVIGSVGRLWFGSVINPHCYDGYHLQPNGSRRCLTNEEWSGDIPECKPVTCQERPESFSHGYFTPEQNPPFKHGFTFVPKCETGFKLSYGVNRTCSHVNYWTGNNARCETISCELTMLENGFYTLGSQKTTSNVISVGLSISPSCNDGYHLSNSNNRTCKENGEISGDSPLCKKVQCDSFGPLPNGNMWFKNNTLTIHNAFDYGTTILSECDKGFELRGSVEHRCLKNGSWSGITPICEKIRCTNQTILKDLYQQNTKELLFGDEFIADYNSEHFYLVNGSLDVECAADGSLRWATPQPILASICKVQKNDNFRADTRHCLVDDKCEVGKTITFECREDYQMLQITATCLRNHTWSSRPICTPLSQPTSNGAIIGVSVAVGVAVIAIVIAVLLFLHRRKLRKSKPKTHYEKADELKEQLNVYSEISETHKTDRKKVEDTEECAFASNTRVVVEDKETLNPRYQSCYSVESSKKMPITAIRVDDLYDVVLGSEHGVTMKKQFQVNR